MKISGFIIPGLAMLAKEIPPVPGLVALENPEIGDGAKFEAEYTLEDIAHHHLQTLKPQINSSNSLVLYGYSMGSMVLSMLATELRAELPKDTKFVFLAAPMNSVLQPVVPDELHAKWLTTDPRDAAAFADILRPFFDPSFIARHPQAFADYVNYRRTGQNRQSPKAFVRQLSALRKFEGSKYFGRIRPKEAAFIYGDRDAIVSLKFREEMQRTLPEARFERWPCGHMIFLENEPTKIQQLFRF